MKKKMSPTPKQKTKNPVHVLFTQLVIDITTIKLLSYFLMVKY